MNSYIKSFKGNGRLARYYPIFFSLEPNKEILVQEALDYCQEIGHIGGFAKIREIMSAEPNVMIKEPQWRAEALSKAFHEEKEFAERLTKLHTTEEKSKILIEQSDRHEFYGEYQKGIKCCIDALVDLKNKELIADVCYRLIRMNIFCDNFNQASTYLETLKTTMVYSGTKYKRFVQFIDFLFALRHPDTFATAFYLLETVTTLEDKEEWEFNEFLSFEDIAIYGMICGLLTQNHKMNVERLINNPKFRNHADTIPELVELMNNYKNNKFALISDNVKQLEKYFKLNIYFGQNLQSCIHTIKNQCYIEYIFAYSVVDMKLMSKMFGESLDEIERVLEEYIYNDIIKAKIDAVTHTLHFVEGDERYNAYVTALRAVKKAINLSQEIVLKADAMFDF